MTTMQFKPTRTARMITDSKKRTFLLTVIKGTEPSERVLSSYWDGGSRDYWTMFHFDGLKCVHDDVVIWLGSFYGEAKKNKQSPGQVLVNTGVMQGKPSYPCFTVFEEDLDRFKLIMVDGEVSPM